MQPNGIGSQTAISRPEEPTGWVPALFEASPFGMVVTDHQGFVLTANPQAAEILFGGGRSAEGHRVLRSDLRATAAAEPAGPRQRLPD